ncbi:hypothetical protein BA891_08125 [Vibrio natriegens]|nr:hypothetical protein BA891_08125 [Vibrio natriegens]
MKADKKPCDILRNPKNDGLHKVPATHNIDKSIGLDWLTHLSRIDYSNMKPTLKPNLSDGVRLLVLSLIIKKHQMKCVTVLLSLKRFINEKFVTNTRKLYYSTC